MLFHFKTSVFEFALALALLPLCSSKIYEDLDDLPRKSYDFVIVGGGTSGLVVANRLSEISHFSVLVLEAGITSANVLDSEVPLLFNGLLVEPNKYDWNYSTIPQAALNGRVMPYQRAFMLGGCSAHNIMLYTRGSRDDWDNYARLSGDEGWSWDRIFPYFLKTEKWTPPVDDHNTTGQFDPSAHSTTGKLPIGLSGFQWPLTPRVIQASHEQTEIPFNLDWNDGSVLGVGYTQVTIGRGVRSTSAKSYLFPESVQRRPNLDVLLHAQVTRLVQPRTVNGLLSFGGVEFITFGKTSVVRARKEIILSGGTVGSTVVLLHSGIGDQNDLAALGIPSLLHLPSVGRNVSDHPAVAQAWFVNSTETIESTTLNATALNEALALWNETHGGPLSMPASTNVAWTRLKDDDPIFLNFTDPAAGREAPHIEITFSAGIAPIGSAAPAPAGNHLSMSAVVVSPVSRGSIKLNSSDPRQPPLIDPGFLTSPFDLYTLRAAIRMAQQYLKTPAFADYVLDPVVDLSAMSEEVLEQFIRNNTNSFAHLVGSNGMSRRGAGYGVVDPDLRVKGTKGLRVIDASVLPLILSAHTQSAAYAFAERGADLVKATWR
ncbi:hypothetical protein MKEN_00762700 [Mycena kentingensis (nom. inval.)]|nr:hypothetical protein MKEN_00762700 [Mycena kentingensis (nom. inval.)]